jgi:PKD repeat protein
VSLFKISPAFIRYQIFQSNLSLSFRAALISILVCASIFLFVPKGYTAQATLEWEPVIHPNLAGYKIHQGNSSLNYDFPIDVGNWTSCTIGDLLEGETYYFAVTAYDNYGNESDYSNEVSYSPSNSPPKANFRVDPMSGEAPLDVIFDATACSDSDGTVVSYEWDFGDGATSTDSVASHTYSSPKSHTVSLTITDDLGATDTATATNAVLNPVVVDPTTMHLDSLQGKSISKGKKGWWKAIITVTINDEDGNPVSNATVFGEWSGAASGKVSGMTGSGGTIKFTTDKMKDGNSVTFTVVDVTHDTYSYDPDANHNGNSITVYRN